MLHLRFGVLHFVACLQRLGVVVLGLDLGWLEHRLLFYGVGLVIGLRGGFTLEFGSLLAQV